MQSMGSDLGCSADQSGVIANQECRSHARDNNCVEIRSRRNDLTMTSVYHRLLLDRIATNSCARGSTALQIVLWIREPHLRNFATRK